MLPFLASGIMLLPLLHDIFPFSLFLARIDEFANPLGQRFHALSRPILDDLDTLCIGHPICVAVRYTGRAVSVT